MKDGKHMKMNLKKMLLGHIFGEGYELSQLKLSFGLMDNIDFTIGLFGRGELVKRLGMFADSIHDSFAIIFYKF